MTNRTEPHWFEAVHKISKSLNGMTTPEVWVRSLLSLQNQNMANLCQVKLLLAPSFPIIWDIISTRLFCPSISSSHKGDKWHLLKFSKQGPEGSVTSLSGWWRALTRDKLLKNLPQHTRFVPICGIFKFAYHIRLTPPFVGEIYYCNGKNENSLFGSWIIL